MNNQGLGLLWLLLLTGSATADVTAPWQDIQGRNSSTSTAVSAKPQVYRLLALDESQLKAQLSVSTGEQVAARGEQTLQLPLPAGGFATVVATPTEVLAADVAAANPGIQTWRVTGTDGKVLSGVLDFTPLGFHAMLDLPNGDTVFIDPQSGNGSRQYASFSKRDNKEAFAKAGFTCAEHGKSASFPATLPVPSTRAAAARAGEALHTYDLAIAATGEYTQYFGSQQAALSAIVTTLNRVNQIYVRDLSIRFRLVSGTNLIYTNATTDPYSNGNAPAMLRENSTNLDQVLGNSAYDIGHVFGIAASSGLATVEALCDSDDKAQGTTGFTRPQGDAFDVDFVAHEMGHQVGATHTFNSASQGSCNTANREAATAYEPGSGSTIMAYAGICQADNLQSNSDAMFHAGSIAQIKAYAHDGFGASCATASSTGNSNPVANAGSDYTIPAGTPFVLTGAGTDANSDSLTYSWEQMDSGTASNVNVDQGDNALFRTHLPTISPERFFPPLSDLIKGQTSAGEALPVTSRELNFRLQVRDGKGGTGEDDMTVTVHNTGKAFAVTAPTNTTFVPGSAQVVEWEVAGTNLSPINCSQVDIYLNTDGSNTFARLLAATPNDGSATVTLPLTLGTSNRLAVVCSNNVFFALSATRPKAASTTNTTSSSSSTVAVSSSSGGGGGMPAGALVLGGLSMLLRRFYPREKGNQS